MTVHLALTSCACQPCAGLALVHMKFTSCRHHMEALACSSRAMGTSSSGHTMLSMLPMATSSMRFQLGSQATILGTRNPPPRLTLAT